MTITQKSIRERGGAGRLGRHVEFDSRSRKFPALALRRKVVVLRTKTWTRRIWAFDQGDLGSCTGNGAVGLLATAPFRRTSERDVNEKLAVQVYGGATEIDPWAGSWPPDDTGSSVLAALKTLQSMGRIASYHWCFGLQDALATLASVGPIEVGVNWYSGFDSPDARGLVRIRGGIRGGHAFEVLGVDVAREEVVAENSWGMSWGLKGRFRFSWADFDRLLCEDGEAATIVR